MRSHTIPQQQEQQEEQPQQRSKPSLRMRAPVHAAVPLLILSACYVACGEAATPAVTRKRINVPDQAKTGEFEFGRRVNLERGLEYLFDRELVDDGMSMSMSFSFSMNVGFGGTDGAPGMAGATNRAAPAPAPGPSSTADKSSAGTEGDSEHTSIEHFDANTTSENITSSSGSTALGALAGVAVVAAALLYANSKRKRGASAAAGSLLKPGLLKPGAPDDDDVSVGTAWSSVDVPMAGDSPLMHISVSSEEGHWSNETRGESFHDVSLGEAPLGPLEPVPETDTL